MTTLAFLCRKLLGLPDASQNWHCPFCDEKRERTRRFKVREELVKGPRFKCYRCDQWGDGHDLLILLRPTLNYDQRRQLIEATAAELARTSAADLLDSLPPGTGNGDAPPCDECRRRAIEQRREDRVNYYGHFDKLTGAEFETLALAAKIEFRVGGKPSKLAQYCLGTVTWHASLDQMFRAMEAEEAAWAEEQNEREVRIAAIMKKAREQPWPRVAPLVSKNGKGHH
jgi:hypothetical protein